MADSRRRRAAQRRTELRMLLSDPAQLAGLRARLRRLLRTYGENSIDSDAIVFATEEAATNALLACKPGSCRVEVNVALIEQFVCIEVRNTGSGMKGVCLDPARLASLDVEHGRGLRLMDALMESLEFVPRSQGTLVRTTKRLAEAGEQEGVAADRLAS